ncbi:MAG: aminopeptidase N C-terminal domain-containing protein, partial [Planctomycetota bacterium]|nr:aminopeptidase N C-terminal domain-containing protein [Planctomycetota bacterium]
VDAVHAAREFARREIANLLRDDLLSVYESARVHEPYAFERSQIDARRLARATLGYLAALAEPDTNTLLIQQFDSADNMTNQWAALELLTDIDCPERQQAIDAFYERWKDEPLVVDKWFTVQALSTLPGAATRVRELTTHPDFTLDNPNRARSLLGAFAILNQVRFHEADGTGYTLVADQLLDLDSINPQVASRLVSAFNHWKKLDSGRQDLMRAQLERVAAKPNLSKDVYEIVGRALGRV